MRRHAALRKAGGASGAPLDRNSQLATLHTHPDTHRRRRGGSAPLQSALRNAETRNQAPGTKFGQAGGGASVNDSVNICSNNLKTTSNQ